MNIKAKLRMPCRWLLVYFWDVQISSSYLPSQIRFPIGGERVTCRGSKLTYSLEKKKHVNFGLARDQFVGFETAESRHKALFFYFWVGRYNKTLNDCSRLKQQGVLFPLNLNVPLISEDQTNWRKKTQNVSKVIHNLFKRSKANIPLHLELLHF